MFDDFFVRALFAGVGTALVAGPMGCFVVWRRMAYFGDTMAHSALLGLALALLAGVSPFAGVFAVTALLAIVLLVLERRPGLSADSLLGILSHAALAIGIVLVSLMTWVRVDLMGLLIGDVLAVTKADLVALYAGGMIVLTVLSAIWTPLVAGTVSEGIAEAEGLAASRARVIFTLLMAIVIAIAMKIVGVILITALLIIPAAAARRLAVTPESMAVLAALAGAMSAVGGLYGSLAFNTPSGPSIVVAAFAVFLASLAAGAAITAFNNREEPEHAA